jgi:chemotaxis signal transduction protein
VTSSYLNVLLAVVGRTLVETRMSIALIPVRVESEWLLLDAALVQEILGAQPWLSMPHARRELPGVVAWRGRAVPLLDLAAVLALGSLEAQASRARTLIAQTERGFLALPVDEVREVQSFTPEQIREAHAVERPYAPREADLQGTVMPVLDLASLVATLTGNASHDSSA